MYRMGTLPGQPLRAVANIRYKRLSTWMRRIQNAFPCGAWERDKYSTNFYEKSILNQYVFLIFMRYVKMTLYKSLGT
jgi:hypothetical protein